MGGGPFFVLILHKCQLESGLKNQFYEDAHVFFVTQIPMVPRSKPPTGVSTPPVEV